VNNLNAGKMNTLEKKTFIQKNLDKVNEPFLEEIYNKMISFLEDSLLEESEEDIKKGNLTSHDVLKKEVHQWRNTR
jgi:hypothetical protein